MEALKKVVLVASDVLDSLLGKDLPDPRTDIYDKYR